MPSPLARYQYLTGHCGWPDGCMYAETSGRASGRQVEPGNPAEGRLRGHAAVGHAAESHHRGAHGCRYLPHCPPHR
eukprot:9479734-Pyramimonas_sp.AAC.2